MRACWRLSIAATLLLSGVCWTSDAEVPLTIVVMDPLARPLSCACVKGYAQRNYDLLAAYLQARLGRRVRVLYSEALARAIQAAGGDNVDLIIGKDSLVRSDATECGLRVRPLARLTGKHGKTTLTGRFVVPSGDAARRLSDLKGYRIIFGPPDSDEKHAAAMAALRQAAVLAPREIETRAGCSEAALVALESDAKPGTAAVISSYALALLEGCGTIARGRLRVVGDTAPVPFVTAFASETVGEKSCRQIVSALLSVRGEADLLRGLESKSGFVSVSPKNSAEKSPAVEWTGWRGPKRDGIAPWLPRKLPESPRVLWKRQLTGRGLAGLAATGRHVIVADRDALDARDVFRCLRADTGDQVWELSYSAPGNLDFSNSVRATPQIHDGKVYLLGAFGHLHCVAIDDGTVVWRTNVVVKFGAKLPTWGMCGSVLLAGERVIVNPGAPSASLVGLNRHTGEVEWQSPGAAAAYASFITGSLGGLEQIVGYDATSLGGWDVRTGKRLWRLVPPDTGDYNVPTPVAVEGKLLVGTENNGTRVYGFDAGGVIVAEPLALNEDLNPDTSSPVVMDGKVFGSPGRGEMFCLDLQDGLKTLWTVEDEAFENYVSVIGCGDRLLVTSTRGELLLLRVARAGCEILSRLELFGSDAHVYSHPAIVGRRLYVRDESSISCVALEERQPSGPARATVQQVESGARLR